MQVKSNFFYIHIATFFQIAPRGPRNQDPGGLWKPEKIPQALAAVKYKCYICRRYGYKQKH